jgi:hypothetical protein
MAAQSTVKVIWNGAAVELGTRRAAMKAVERTGWFLLDKANETIPEETGDLKNQGKVGFKTTSGVLTSVKISYPGDTGGLASGPGHQEGKIVAIVQHEDTTLKHNPPGRAKWLQLAIQENREEALRMLGEDLRAWFGTGIPL